MAIINLNTACPFALLAGTTITDIPPSVITGDVGVSPGPGTAQLVSCPEVTGNIYVTSPGGPSAACQIVDPVLLTQAKLDLQAAIIAGYGILPTKPVDTPLQGVITPGIYPYSAGLLIVAANPPVFTGVGDYVFQIPTLLTVDVAVIMAVAGGADPKRIFFVVDTATINTGVTFKGSVLAQTSISAGNLSDIEGKLLAHDGAVTLDENTVNSNSCGAGICEDIIVLPLNLPNYRVNKPYSQFISASGGTEPYEFFVTSGSLPPGLSLNPTTGEISGTSSSKETYSFTITATDFTGCSNSQSYRIRGVVRGFSFCLCGVNNYNINNIT